MFLCTGNACRSPMAEGFGRAYLPDTYTVHSAGVRPIGVDERTRRVMEEIGIDIGDQQSHSLDQVPSDPTLVISLSEPAAREASRVFDSGTPLEQWKVQDPYGARGSMERQLEQFRTVRDTIKQKMTSRWPAYFD